MRTITRDELATRLASDDRIRLVMPLTRWAYQQEHIPGTECFDSVEEALSELAKDDEIVLYDTGFPCIASQWAYRALVSHGYRNVRVYEGGLQDWDGAGMPVVCASQPLPGTDDEQVNEFERRAFRSKA